MKMALIKNPKYRKCGTWLNIGKPFRPGLKIKSNHYDYLHEIKYRINYYTDVCFTHTFMYKFKFNEIWKWHSKRSIGTKESRITDKSPICAKVTRWMKIRWRFAHKKKAKFIKARKFSIKMQLAMKMDGLVWWRLNRRFVGIEFCKQRTIDVDNYNTFSKDWKSKKKNPNNWLFSSAIFRFPLDSNTKK